ncbi:MAG: hypothetical protein FH748_10765 [Balneolaceae bacterium]|nr:hypothetical protein [Balneolaceae bacterium]
MDGKTRYDYIRPLNAAADIISFESADNNISTLDYDGGNYGIFLPNGEPYDSIKITFYDGNKAHSEPIGYCTESANIGSWH